MKVLIVYYSFRIFNDKKFIYLYFLRQYEMAHSNKSDHKILKNINNQPNNLQFSNNNDVEVKIYDKKNN